MEGMWNVTTIQEKEAIIKDLQYFLSKEVPEEESEALEAGVAAVKIEDVTEDSK